MEGCTYWHVTTLVILVHLFVKYLNDAYPKKDQRLVDIDQAMNLWGIALANAIAQLNLVQDMRALFAAVQQC